MTANLTGGNAYANDPDYDAGIHTTTPRRVEVYDWSTRRWRVCTLHGMATAQDRVAPAQPDAMIDTTEVLHDPDSPWAAAIEGKQRAKAERAAELLPRVIAYLDEHGPASAPTIGDALLGIKSSQRLLGTLRGNPDTFVFLAGQFKLWGLVGREYQFPKIKKVSALMMAIRDCLDTHGPQTCMEIAMRLGAHPKSIHNSIGGHREWFTIVSVRAGTGNTPPARVWGLVA